MKSTHGASVHGPLVRLLSLLWFALLLLPLATVLPLVNAWEATRWQAALASVWIALFAWFVLPRKAALVATFPIVYAGLVLVAADGLRGADLLELLSVRYTFRADEVAGALRPYLLPSALAGASLLCVAIVLWRGAGRRTRPATALAAMLSLAGLALALHLPPQSWRNAWPAVLAGAIAEGHTGDAGIGLPATADVRVSPRDRAATWHALRSREAAAGGETYVLVIGESVRADRLPACGGRPQVSAGPANAIVFCDVLSGSSSTHTSVPLLISRALPGHRERVPRDASLVKAFEEAGFETFWLAVQDRTIAWPDARNSAFDATPALDRDALLPLLDRALARPAPRQLIVLHAYNAHAAYTQRYRPGVAPFAVDAARLGSGVPTREALADWWNAYDDAVDESMRFLAEVTARLRARTGESFLLYTPDHAENMLDDARGLTLHALKMPTLWDTAVPAIAWANDAWRKAHAPQWTMLQANRTRPLMHMDFAPTLLGAADIRYAEPRSLPVDLTARAAPPRERFTQVRAGETVKLDALRAQAQALREH